MERRWTMRTKSICLLGVWLIAAAPLIAQPQLQPDLPPPYVPPGPTPVIPRSDGIGPPIQPLIPAPQPRSFVRRRRQRPPNARLSLCQSDLRQRRQFSAADRAAREVFRRRADHAVPAIVGGGGQWRSQPAAQ